jgi:hypothetical protein
MDQQPNVDDLFPVQAKSVDDLFPQEIEKDRYRRQTLGTSPVQDLIFGDTTVNPIARVLDAFGQGAKQGWGAEPAGLSQESTDALKKWGIFNDYDAGQKSIIKAANESLFRGAAMFVVDPVMRGLPAAFRGTQAAVAQVGEEAGQPKLGREAAGAFEAFPSGLRAPTGIPHAAPHPMLAEIERARSLGVIGAGEEGYLGTKPAEVAPPISSAQETPKAVEATVEPQAAPRAEVPAPAAPEPGLPAPEVAPRTGPSPIVEDVAQKLISAGRPVEEARASGELIASHYEARSGRFSGQRGTADEMYAADAPDIRPGEGAGPVRSEPIKPEPTGSAGAAEPVKAEVAKPEEAVTGFTTAKGSTYTVHEDGTTTRDKAARSDAGHEGDSGVKPKTDKTIYVDADRASALSGAGISGAGEKGFRVIVKDGKASLLSWNEKADKWGISPLSRDIPFTDKPEVGKAPVELWKPANDVPGHEAYRGQHAGNKITEIKTAAPSELELNQIKRGKITLRGDAKPIITLFKDANASTFVHETGHAWLEELMKDSEHPKAPGSLRDDADSVREWLGVHSAEDIKTSHHEKFARGFERYMMEGKAPNQALANVFEKFKNWLTKIYQTVTRLKSPINDEIRGVFDRLLTMHPSEVRIEPEGPPKTFADIHETDALHTAPEAAHPVAETIQAERDMLANEHIPEEHDARLEGVTSKAGRREAGGPQPLRDGNEAPRPEEASNDQATGAVGEGGSSPPTEGARPSVGGGKTEAPVSPQSNFTGPESPLIDKAGNIRLDNLGTPEDVNKAIRDAAAENNEFIDARRGIVTDGQVLELADALGMDAGQLNQRKLGQAYNAEQIMAARKLLIQSATTVRDAMVKAAAGSEADIMAYAEAKARHQMIQEQVAGITAEAGRALRAFRKLEGQQEAGQIDAFLKDATGKTLFQLQQEAKLGSQLPTPAQVSKFVNDSSKPTWKDMLVEGWMSFLLSGAKTHMANIMGNTISGLWRPVETATAAAIGKARNIVTGSQDRVLIGEASAELFGMIHGSKEGIVAAYKAFKTEEPQLTNARQMEQGHPKALPSFTINAFGREMEIGGKQVRIPLRLLGAEDEFFKSVAFRGDINRQSYAIASKENLPPEKFNMRVAELSMNPTEEMAAAAKEVADYQTFQTPLGKVGRSIQAFSNSHVLAKFIVPFVRTPVNLLKYAGERTPLGLFSEEVRNNLSGKNGAVARDTQIARITLGTMIGVAAFEMASQGLITGGGPKDSNKRAVMQADGWQDYSVRVGDMYYRYNRLDPFSVILGVVADAYEVHSALSSDHPEKEHIPALVFAAISKNILNRASLQGASDFIQAAYDPERYGKNYIKGMVGTVVPAFLNQATQTMDPVVRQTHTVLEGIKARIPGLSEDLLPRRDVWGEPVVREGGLGPDIASPIMESRIKNDPVNKALMAANYFPGKLDKKIRGIELTDQQYDDYSRVAGRMAKVRLNAMVNVISNPNLPEAARHDMIQNTIKASRESAQSLIIMQSVNSDNDIMKKAMAAKITKATGEVH